MGIKVNLKNVRVGYLNAFEKSKDSTDKDGKLVKGKYQGTIYLDPDDAQIEVLEEAALKVLTEAFNSEEAAEKWMKRNYGFGNHADKCCVRDLAERDNLVEGMEEGLYLKATSHKRPLIMTSIGEKQTERGFTIDEEEIEGKEIYSGCFANVSIELYWYKDYKCLLASFLGIRFKGEGEAFGGAGEYANEDDLDDGGEAPRSGKSKPKPSRRSRDEDDEEEDEKPRRRRPRDEEEDEDEEEERPRRRRR